MSSKKAPAKLSVPVVKKPVAPVIPPVKPDVESVAQVDTVVPVAEILGVKEPLVTEASSSVVVKGRKQMVVTPEMEKAITEAKQFIKDKMNKAEAAREVFDMLKDHERRQIVYVFMQGCKLSKAGSSTYYQNAKSKMKKASDKQSGDS